MAPNGLYYFSFHSKEYDLIADCTLTKRESINILELKK
jgi:hypothetical protein